MQLQGNFFSRGKKFRLILDDAKLSWEPEATPDLCQTVLTSEIICCWLCPRGSLKCNAQNECKHLSTTRGDTPPLSGLSVEFCRRNGKHKWTPSVMVFVHAAKEVLLAWHGAIWTIIHELRDRPQRLFVVINPVGGKKRGSRIYNKKIDPLFRRARIQITQQKTEFKSHGTALIMKASDEGRLKDCQGVVAVGGDGLVNEIATGLFILASHHQSKNPHDPQIDLPETHIRLGIIPSGSTDATCFATHGCSDPVTAALHIIMGDRRGVDVASIHTRSHLERIVTTMVSYGYFGDLLKASENMRCIGPARYLLSGVQQFIKNNSYPVRVRVRKIPFENSLSSQSITSSVSCNSVCSICSNYPEDQTLLPTDTSDSDWLEISGKFSVVSAAISSCACRFTPQGVSPSAHLGDGHTDLILVDGSSRTKLLSYLYHTSVTGNATSLNHVRMIRTNEVQFSAAPFERSSSWNCDGEQLVAPSLNIKVHRQKLNLFCRGIEDLPFSTTEAVKNIL